MNIWGCPCWGALGCRGGTQGRSNGVEWLSEGQLPGVLRVLARCVALGRSSTSPVQLKHLPHGQLQGLRRRPGLGQTFVISHCHLPLTDTLPCGSCHAPTWPHWE